MIEGINKEPYFAIILMLSLLKQGSCKTYYIPFKVTTGTRDIPFLGQVM